MFEPEGTREVREGGSGDRTGRKMAERGKCDGDLAGEVRCSVLGRALGFPEVVTELRSGG